MNRMPDPELHFKDRMKTRSENGMILSAVIKASVRAYYEIHPTGGPLHITTDDYNAEDGHLDFCERGCALEGDVAGVAIIGMLRHIDSPMGREAVLRGEHIGWPNRNGPNEASAFYCHNCLDRPFAKGSMLGTTVDCPTCYESGFLMDGSDNE